MSHDNTFLANPVKQAKTYFVFNSQVGTEKMQKIKSCNATDWLKFTRKTLPKH
jgi:hypothetical protein